MKDVMWIQRSRNIRGSLNAGSYPYAGQYSAEIQCIQLYGILKGKEECADDFR